jgi:ribonuclease BN (tRNA processing enzyme)
MRLRVLGSNGTYPTPGRPASGYLIEHAGSLVLLDAGPGTAAALQEAADPAALSSLVLTHVHPDHCADTLALFNLFRFGIPDRRGIPALAPEGVAERLAGFLGAPPEHDFFRVFAWDEVAAGDRRRIGEIEIDFGRADHPVPAVTVGIAAGGRRLVYSGDTGPGGDLVSFAVGADVLLCEATFQGDPRESRWPYHLAATEAGAIAREAGVARLLVTHVVPMLDPARSVDEARAAFGGPTDWAAPGMEVTV